MLESASILMERNKITSDDLSLLVPHQANLRINNMVCEKMGIPDTKVYNNIQRYGNTTSASLPLCMSEAVKEGKLKEGDLVMTVAFGSGLPGVQTYFVGKKKKKKMNSLNKTLPTFL